MGWRYKNAEERRLAKLERRRASYPKDKEKRLAATKISQIKRRLKNPNLGQELYKRRIQLDPLWNRRTNLRDYGLTIEEYEMRWETQGGVCIICEQPETDIINGKLKWLAVDHDPKFTTKQIRDLACSKCNRGLGLFRDNPEILESAANYLRKWQGVYSG